VAPGRREERKSVGVERTFRDKTDDNEIMEMLTEIAEELHKDMENLQYAGKTVTVKYKLHTFESKSSGNGVDSIDKTRAQSVKKYISTKDEILPVCTELWNTTEYRSPRSCSRGNCHCEFDFSGSACLR
jgi:DNA polymerase kappa